MQHAIFFRCLRPLNFFECDANRYTAISLAMPRLAPFLSVTIKKVYVLHSPQFTAIHHTKKLNNSDRWPNTFMSHVSEMVGTK